MRASIEPKELEVMKTGWSPIHYRTVVEIGVHRGYSLELWRELFNPCLLIGIESDIAHLDLVAVEQADAQVIHGDSAHPETKEMLIKALGDKMIDFLFIDGDHTYEAVKKDYEIYKTLVRPGGVIVFHDAGIKDHPQVEVHKFWAELTDKFDRYMFTHPA